MFFSFQRKKFNEFLEQALNKLLKQNFAINFEDSKDKFDRFPAFRLFLRFIKEFTIIIRFVSRSSKYVQKNMENISTRTQSLQNSSDSIHESVSTIVSDMKQTSIEIEDSHADITSIRSKMKIMIYSNSLIQENSGTIKSKLKDGVSNMENSVHLIGELVEQNKELQTTIMELWSNFSKLSQSVLELTKLTDQSKMLALNAEIEAEHAGESGKGFAIVAKEMGKLSESSAKSARDIIRKIKELQDSAKLTELNISGSVEFATGANEQIQIAHKIYSDINESIQNVTDESSEFTKSFTELDQNISNIDNVFKETIQKMKLKVDESQKIIERTKSQSNETKAILDFTNATLGTSWTLNSIISLFSIKDFNKQNDQKNKLENLLDSILSIRGIIVASLFSNSGEINSIFMNTVSDLLIKIAKIRSELQNIQNPPEETFFTNIRYIEDLSKKIAISLEANEKEIASASFEKEFKIIFPTMISQIIQELGKLE